MTGLFHDFRYALRQLRKSPGFTAVAVVTLALGIGANTAVFSVIDAVMLRPLPYDRPERLVAAESANSRSPGFGPLSYPDFFDWRSRNHTLAHLVSYHDNALTLNGLDRPIQLDGVVVSWDLLPALGISPELGRGFTSDEEKVGTRVILISHALWTSRFASDKAILGRQLKLSGNLYSVIGVMPQSFRFPVNAPRNDFWTTLAVDDDPTDPEPNTVSRGSHFLNVFGRMKPGVKLEQVDQDLKTIAANLAKEYPNTNTRHDSARTRTAIAALLGDTRPAPDRPAVDRREPRLECARRPRGLWTGVSCYSRGPPPHRQQRSPGSRGRSRPTRSGVLSIAFVRCWIHLRDHPRHHLLAKQPCLHSQRGWTKRNSGTRLAPVVSCCRASGGRTRSHRRGRSSYQQLRKSPADK